MKSKACSVLAVAVLVLQFTCVTYADVQTAIIEDMIARGELQEAMSEVGRQLKGDPGNTSLLFLKGLIHSRRNELDQARDTFLKLTREHPELPEPFNNLAVIYAAQGNLERARDALNQAISTHPSYATAHENLGDIYAKMASNAYNQALELDESNEAAREKLVMVNDLFPGEVADRPRDQAIEADLEQARAEITRLENTLAELRAEAEQVRRENNNLQEQVRQVMTARDVDQNDAAERRDRLARELEKSRAELEQTRRELAMLEQQLTAARLEAEQTSPVPEPGPEPRQQPAGQDEAQLLQAVTDWAEAWSRQDIDSYLSAYSETFAPQDATRQVWLRQRRERLSAPDYINVRLLEPAVTFVDANQARVTFFQEYESDTYRDRVFKTLFMARQNGRWVIEEELSN